MKTTMKKIFSLLLVAVLLVGVMPFQAFAATNVPYRVTVNGTVVGFPTSSAGETSMSILESFVDPQYLDASKYNITWIDRYTEQPVAPGAGGIIPVKEATEIGYPEGWIHNFDATVTPVTATCSSCQTTYNVIDGHICCPTCKKVGGGHETTCLDQCKNDATCTNGAHLSTCVGPCDGTADCESTAGHVTTCLSLKVCSYCNEKGHLITDGTCPDMYYECGCSKVDGHKPTCTAVKYSVTFDPNYNEKKAIVLDNITAGSKIVGMYTPTRPNYTFTGWYWDARLTDRVGNNEVVSEDCIVYASWVPNVSHEVYVKLYTNGNTSSVTKYVDLYEWSQDGWITLNDITVVANKYLKASNDAGLSVYGPFDASGWEDYCLDDYARNPMAKVEVNGNQKTVIYAMVHNVNLSASNSSSSTARADSSNPKTGDMIFMPAAVLGLSVSALAVMFYLNKKRAV